MTIYEGVGPVRVSNGNARTLIELWQEDENKRWGAVPTHRFGDLGDEDPNTVAVGMIIRAKWRVEVGENEISFSYTLLDNPWGVGPFGDPLPHNCDRLCCGGDCRA